MMKKTIKNEPPANGPKGVPSITTTQVHPYTSTKQREYQ